MDESFPAKRLKSNKMINRAMSRSETTLHISEQFMGFNILKVFWIKAKMIAKR